MSIKFHVPTLQNQQSAQELKDMILTSEPKASIEVDSQTKVVTIDSEASKETFKQLIVAAGHSVESA